MKQPPRGAVFEKKKMSRTEFLQGALERLNNDVGSYFEMRDEYAKKTGKQVGFWASIRMIMPIVEAVSHVVGTKPQELLENHLDITTPYLAWDLFRHSLMHGDYLQHGKYQGKDVGWGVLFLGSGHIIQSRNLSIDPITLYEKLKEYLENEISKNDQTEVEIEVGVIYQAPKQEIIDDFAKL